MDATVKNVLCYPLQNGAIDITAGSSFLPLQYSWSSGEVTQDLSALDTGTYHITVTDAHNCTVDSFLHVSNDNIFSIHATPDTVTVNLGHAVALTVVPIGSVLGSVVWSPSIGLTCADCTSPVSSVNESITYFIAAIDTNGCEANDVVRINVIPTYIAFVPNAFTPNGDGNNDFFEVFGNKEAWKQFEVAVFDRLGEKVFESNDMNFKWDGTYKGTVMNPTVLVYEVKVIYLNNYSEKLFKGTVTLIR
jgi:gliding motility-associated-like protein